MLMTYSVCAFDEDSDEYKTISNLDVFGVILHLVFWPTASFSGRCVDLCPSICNHLPCRVDFESSNGSCKCITDSSFTCGANSICNAEDEVCECMSGYTGDALAGCKVENQPRAGRITLDDFVYIGAFQLRPGNYGGDDTTYSINYAVGTMAYDASRHSLFIAGHAQQTRIAEYPIPTPGKQEMVAQLPLSDTPLQDFFSPIDAVDNVEGLDRITGLMVDERGQLLVNAETWYGTNNAVDTTLIVRDASSMATSAIDGFYHMACKQNCAGYVGAIPPEWREAFGSSHYTGWSSVYSINARYSHGPSLWTFDANNIGPATAYLNYPFDGGEEQWLSERAIEVAPQGTAGPFPKADPLWNDLSKAFYGFFTNSVFCVIGSTGGLSSGVGYKAVQSDGNTCGGPCSYDPSDNYNYVWFYDVDEILASQEAYQPRPYYYGVWELPFDEGGKHTIIGGTYDEIEGVLYVALDSAAQVGDYDRPPLIVTFSVP